MFPPLLLEVGVLQELVHRFDVVLFVVPQVRNVRGFTPPLREDLPLRVDFPKGKVQDLHTACSKNVAVVNNVTALQTIFFCFKEQQIWGLTYGGPELGPPGICAADKSPIWSRERVRGSSLWPFPL